MRQLLKAKKTLVILLVAIGIGLIVFFTIGKPEPDTVRIVTPPSIIASLPHWIAEEKGYYRDEGLAVRTVSVTSSQYMAEAISANDADVLPAVSLVDVINSQIKALDRPLIYSHSRMRSNPPFESVIVLTGSSIASPKDLDNRRIAVYPGATATECLRTYLAEQGINVSAITFRPLVPPEHVPALQRGDVDASHLYDPDRTLAIQGGLCRELIRGVYPSFNEPSAIGCSAVSARFAQERPEALKKYLRAWDRSIGIIRDDPETARTILARKLNLSPEVAINATWVDATMSAELDLKAIQSTIATISKFGLVPTDFDASDPSYIWRRQ
jgi:NitT/TauT family transport system substrate-binding protein